ncbi:hypothetical protein SRHO_G00083420 [Serrasalmus rhombeus]
MTSRWQPVGWPNREEERRGTSRGVPRGGRPTSRAAEGQMAKASCGTNMVQFLSPKEQKSLSSLSWSLELGILQCVLIAPSGIQVSDYCPME